METQDIPKRGKLLNELPEYLFKHKEVSVGMTILAIIFTGFNIAQALSVTAAVFVSLAIAFTMEWLVGELKSAKSIFNRIYSAKSLDESSQENLYFLHVRDCITRMFFLAIFYTTLAFFFDTVILVIIGVAFIIFMYFVDVSRISNSGY